MSTAKSSNRHILHYLLGRVFVALLALASFKVYTNRLSLKDYGDLNVFFTVSAFLTATVFGWADAASIRFFPGCDVSQRRRFLSTVLLAVGALSALGVVSTMVPFGMGRLDLGVATFGAIACYALLLPVSNILKQVIRSKGNSTFFNFLESFEKMISFGVVVAASLTGSLSLAIVVGSLVVGLLAVLVLSLWDRDLIRLARPDRGVLVQCLRYGVPLSLASFGMTLLNSCDKLLVKYYCGSADLALYSAGYTIIDRTLTICGQVLIMAQLPLLIRAWDNENREECCVLVSQNIQKCLLALVPIVMLAFLFGKETVALLASDKYVGSGDIMAVIGVGSVLLTISYLMQQILVVNHLSKLILFNTMISALLNIALNLIFIPRFGYKVAAWTTLASYLLLMCSTWFQVRALVTFRIDLVSGGKVAIALALVWLCHELLTGFHVVGGNLAWIAQSGCYLALYFAFLALLREGNVLQAIVALRKKLVSSGQAS